MRIAHFILAHKDPAFVERLIRRLSHPDADFYIHIDSKADIEAFLYLGKIPQVSFIKERVDVKWGGYNLLKAMLVPMQEIMATGRHYDFFNHLSGQDYLLKSVEEIHAFFEKQIGRSFIYCKNPQEDPEFWREHMTRVSRWHMTNFDFRGRYFVEKLLNAVLPARKFPLPYTLYGGSSGYWTISNECATYVLNFLKEHPEVEKFAKFMWGSDEIIIPTVVMNSHLKEKVVRDNCRYIYFRKGEPNPKILQAEDFNNLISSGKLFARKFDPQKDSRILDMLDGAVDN
jgi:hypothetical protein